MFKKSMLFINIFFSLGAHANSSRDLLNSPPTFKNQLHKSIDGVETYTYIKCSYRKNMDSTFDATSSWQWGILKDSKNDYAKIKGRWHSSYMLTNIFFTEASYKEINEICTNTLKNKKISYTDLIPYASDYTLSFYYNFWHEGKNVPTVTIGDSVLDRMIIFGDSLSDAINVYNGSYGTVPNSKSWYLGHFTNGLVWHEYLSKKHLFIPSYSWATGNAESGNGNIFLGFNQQVKSFQSYISKSKDYNIEKSLFLILFGGNDIISGNKKTDDMIQNYTLALNHLIGMGAKKIAVLNLPNLAIVPVTKSMTQKERSIIENKTKDFNQKLGQLITTLKPKYPNVKFISLDLYSAFNEIVSQSHKYGFKNNSDACLHLKRSSLSYISGASPTQDCKNNDANYIFWDNMHPTSKAHEAISSLLSRDLLRSL